MSEMLTSDIRFRLGQLLVTPGVLQRLSSEEVLSALARHTACDWGDVNDEDRIENERSRKKGCRLFSVYHSANGIKFWIITEADRSVTTVLLPVEY